MKRAAAISILLGIFSVIDELPATNFFVIETGETVNTTQVLTDTGDQGFIMQGGTIDVNALNGVELQDENQFVVNKGSIQTFNGDAIFSDVGAKNSWLENRGSIQTTGSSARGIYNSAVQFRAVNKGSITTKGANSYGIYNLEADYVIFRNEGIISTQGAASMGIHNLRSENIVIGNEKTIQTRGENAHGILDNGSNNSRITNSGLIHTLGNNSVGIYLFNESHPHVINSGTIISEESYAIRFLQTTTPTLTLQKGSNLQGEIESVGDLLNLNVKKGLNLLLTLSEGSEEFGNLTIDNPYLLLNSKQIAVVDETLFYMQEDIAADISDNILGAGLHGCVSDSCNCGFWTQTVSSYAHRRNNDDYHEYNNWHIGQIAGYDSEDCYATIRLFGGYLHGEGETDLALDKLRHNTYFSGLSYAKQICDTCVELIFAAACVNWKQELTVMDNLVDEGVDFYRYERNVTLLTSGVRVTKKFACRRSNPKVTFDLRHAGLYLGKNKSEGINATIGIKDRNIDLLSARLDVAAPNSLSGSCFEPFAGVHCRYQLRGDKLKLKGSIQEFDVGFTDCLVAGVIGLRGYRDICGKELLFSLSGFFDNEKGSRVLGNVGLNF